MRTAFIMCGLIGSGKSGWAKNYVKNNPGTIIVSRDAIREMFSGEYKYNINLEPLIKEFAQMMVYKALHDNFDVIIDEANLTYKARQKWIRIIKKVFPHEARIFCVHCTEQWNNVKYRMQDPKGESKKQWQTVYDGMIRSFQYPAEDDFEPGTWEIINYSLSEEIEKNRGCYDRRF